MRKLHVAGVSLVLALAAVLGTGALTRTTGLGAAARHANDAVVAAKTRQLAAYETKLRQALTAGTPALPPLSKAVSRGAAPATTAPRQRVVYRRPPPVVVVMHASHGDDGHERAEGGGGGDD